MHISQCPRAAGIHGGEKQIDRSCSVQSSFVGQIALRWENNRTAATAYTMSRRFLKKTFRHAASTGWEITKTTLPTVLTMCKLNE